jgi:hypothetical protein
MTITLDLPIWALVLLCLLITALLTLQNLGWLLSSKAMFDWRRRKGGTPPEKPAAEREEPQRGR